MNAKEVRKNRQYQDFYFMVLVIVSLALMVIAATWFGHILSEAQRNYDVITEEEAPKISHQKFVLEISDDYEPAHSFTAASSAENVSNGIQAREAKELEVAFNGEEDLDPLSYDIYTQGNEQLNISERELKLLRNIVRAENNFEVAVDDEDDPDPLSYEPPIPYGSTYFTSESNREIRVVVGDEEDPDPLSCTEPLPYYEQFGFSKRDFYILCKVGQGEYGYGCVKGIAAIIYTVLNRVESDEFPNDIESVVSAEGQFSLRYVSEPFPEPSQAILEAFEYVAQGIDFSNGALYFCNPDLVDAKTLRWFESLEVTAEFEGARFYK